MAKRIDPRIRDNFLDTNFWDKCSNPSENAATLEILDLWKRGEIILTLPFSVKAEIEHPNTPPEIKKQAAGMIYTLPTQLTPKELETHTKLLALIRGNAREGKHDRDVSHLFEAAKHGGGYFITKDVRLLRKVGEVENLLPSLRVVCPSEFVKFFHSGGV